MRITNVLLCSALLLVFTGCDVFLPSGEKVEWVSIPGGSFMMGSDSGDSDEQPVHQVTVPSFEINRTEVTINQYFLCMIDGACTSPRADGSMACKRKRDWRGDNPVSCVDWHQALAFCAWAGGRLPTEAEWEYAARSRGQDITYPWGDQSPMCDYAVMDEVDEGCGENWDWAVCSKTAGNTEQGLCDMAGNVWEWVQDWYHGSYDCDANPGAENCVSGGIAPSDGSAWEDPSGSYRVVRGGSYLDDDPYLRAAHRGLYGPSDFITSEPSRRWGYFGFRCAR